MSEYQIKNYAEWRSYMLDSVGENPGEEALREAFDLYSREGKITLAVMAYERGVRVKDLLARAARAVEALLRCHEALRELIAEQEGPPLLRREDQWHQAMMLARACLPEHQGVHSEAVPDWDDLSPPKAMG